MKIAYLSTFYPYRGGIAQFNGRLYHAFQNAGHEVTAYTFTRQYPGFLFPGETQMVTEKDNAEKVSSIRCVDSINPFSWFSASEIICKESPNVLLMKFWMPYFAPSLGTISGRVRNNGTTKSIAILDNVIPHERRFFDIALIKYFLNRCDGFVVMSEAVKKDLLLLKPNAKYLFNPHPLYNHFGNAVSREDALGKLNLPTDKKIILFFGFIRGYKGLDILIDAMKNLDGSYHLVIAGEVYGSFSQYENQIKELKIENKISSFIRYISDQEVPLFFSAADVCVLPYKSATQSGITQIAFHFNLPVIATNVGGLGEMIINEKTGYLTNSNAEDIVSAVTKYFNQNKKLEFSNNIKVENKKYSWDEMKNTIEKLYEQIHA